MYTARVRTAPTAEQFEWQSHGNCRGESSSIFFVSSSLRGQNKQQKIDDAKSLCGSCDVRQECLDYAMEHKEEFGVWGGTSEEDRALIREQLGSDLPHIDTADRIVAAQALAVHLSRRQAALAREAARRAQAGKPAA